MEFLLNRKFNVFKSPFDSRDHKVGSTVYRDAVNLPETVDYRDKLLPVRDQENTSKCVAFSCCCMKEYQEKIDIGINEYLSPEWIYYYRENSNEDNGMHLRDAMNILRKKGVPREKCWAFKRRMPDGSELPNVVSESLNHTIESYARCDTIESTKKAIATCGPCVFTVPVFTNPDDPIMFWRKGSNSKENGGHCMTMVGYNKEGFIVRNSWGSKWCDKGHVLLPYTDFSIIWDVFCAYDAVSDKNYDYIVKPDPVIKCCCPKK